MTTDIRRDRKPLIIALAVVVLYGVVTFIGWAHYSLFGLHPIQEARSPDGRYVASIMHQRWEGVDYLRLETSFASYRWQGLYAFGTGISGIYPYGVESNEWFGFPDVHFLHSKLTWRDNHTLIVTHVVGPSGMEEPLGSWEWHDVKIIGD